MTDHTTTAGEDLDRLRELADELGCFIEPDFIALTRWTPRTIEAYRKRGELEYIRAGRTYLYPKASAVERFKAATKQAQRRVPAKDVL